MRGILTTSLVAALLMAGNAAAQSESGAGNPVTAHYRAYREALAAGNMEAAEAEAAAALEASIQRSGDGGNTAVLAINLAQARLSLDRREEAYDPALRAHTIAASGQGGVDPLMARLVLGRAQLTERRAPAGRAMLEAAIAEARSRDDLQADRHAAAADLARWLMAQERYDAALAAWAAAAEAAQSAEGDNTYARTEARLGGAVARLASAMAGVTREQARPTDTRMATDAYQAFRVADQALAEAQDLMAPHAYVVGDDSGLTLAQRIYASALAWRTLARAFLTTRGQRPLPDFDVTGPASAGDRRPICHMTIIAEPRPSFPPGARSAFAAGAAVVRFAVDEQGRTTDVQVAAAVPDRWFRDAIERVSARWRLERAPSSPEHCRYAPIVYQTWMFYFR